MQPFLEMRTSKSSRDSAARSCLASDWWKAAPYRAESRRSRATGGLGRADTARLKGALDGLPPEIAYLRRPILVIAKEDQDLLGSGEGDIAQIERALRKTAKRGEIESVALAHAKLLHEWLLSLPDYEGAWAHRLLLSKVCSGASPDLDPIQLSRSGWLCFPERDVNLVKHPGRRARRLYQLQAVFVQPGQFQRPALQLVQVACRARSIGARSRAPRVPPSWWRPLRSKEARCHDGLKSTSGLLRVHGH